MINEFSKEIFEARMANSVTLHNEGHYEDALTQTRSAYDIAPVGSAESGRAARDIAARLDRLERPEEAAEWANEAFQTHAKRVEDFRYDLDAFRERGASALYLGVLGLREYLRDDTGNQLQPDPQVLSSFRNAWADIRTAKQMRGLGINRWVDQYQINAARRVSMAESLLGNKLRGTILGAGAVGLAFMSESPRLSTSNPNASLKQRLAAKSKAFQGGVAALGVNVLLVVKPALSRRLASKAL